MLQYLLTALAGAAIAIVAMRLWQSREGAGAALEGRVEPAISAGDASTPRPRPWLLGASALVLIAALVFAFRGEETAPGQSIGTTNPAASGQQLADVDTMISGLAKRLESNPNDGEGFRMLGWSYLMTGHPDKAIAPYKRALALLPDNAGVHAGYGEALVGLAKGKVTDEARAEFAKAVALDPAEPRARNFLAMWDAQHGKEKAALDKWIALANSGPADAPWQADVRRQIETTSARLGVDVDGRLKSVPPASGLDPASVQAAQAMPEQDRQAMINGMVEGLAERLKANPADADGWIKLLRSRMVLNQGEQAGRDLASARKGLGADKAALARVEAAAKQLGVPGA